MTTATKRNPVKRTKRPGKSRKAGKKEVSSVWKIALAGVLLVLFSPLYYGYVLKTFSSAWRWVKDIGVDPNYRTYKNFNIPIPGDYSIHGIDVSSYQGKINWNKVRDMEDDGLKITFAFVKATEGLLHVDPYFQRNWREAPKAGLVCGAYHYFRPEKKGKLQAIFFLQNVRPEKGDLPMVVDIEELNGVSPATMRKELLAFTRHIEAKTTVKPIIYSNKVFYQDYLKGYVDDYPLWIAHYYKAELKMDSATTWNFWQHSDRATIAGINHVVDMNVFKGDSMAFSKMLIN